MSKDTHLGDGSSSPGNITLNYAAGRAAIAAGASAVTVTSPFCTADCVIHITPLDIDTTLTRYKVAPGAGSFVVTGNANATAAWKFSFQIVKRGDALALA